MLSFVIVTFIDSYFCDNQIWACEAIPTIGVAIANKSGSLLLWIVNWITPGTPDATYVMKLLDQKNISLKNVIVKLISNIEIHAY